MPIDYNKATNFNSKSGRVWSRTELKQVYADLPQGKQSRTAKKVSEATGVAFNTIKALMAQDGWVDYANQQDIFKKNMALSVQESLMIEKKDKFINTRTDMAEKLFKVAEEVLNDEEFMEKVGNILKDVDKAQDLRTSFIIIKDVIAMYSDVLGVTKSNSKDVKLVQNNYNMDCRNMLLDTMFQEEDIVEVEYEDEEIES